MTRKITLTAAIDAYLGHTAIRAFTCEELAKAAAAAIGHKPSLMAVSRVMGSRPGWEKSRSDGRVIFTRSVS